MAASQPQPCLSASLCWQAGTVWPTSCRPSGTCGWVQAVTAWSVGWLCAGIVSVALSHLLSHIWPQIATKGLDALEEMDPVERMRQRYGLDSNNQRSLGSQPVRSLEDELKTLQETLDINNFDYKPVPRTDDEE